MATDIEAGRYIAVHTGTPFGAVICACTRSKFDHVAVSIGGGQVVEATPRGVHVSPLANYAGHLAVANLAEPMTSQQKWTVAAAAQSFVGREYAFGDLAVIELRRLGLTWPWLIHLADTRDALICSELAALCGRQAGLDWLCGEPDPAYVQPAELARRPGVVPVTL
jgi:hypothetical protein